MSIFSQKSALELCGEFHFQKDLIVYFQQYPYMERTNDPRASVVKFKTSQKDQAFIASINSVLDRQDPVKDSKWVNSLSEISFEL